MQCCVVRSFKYSDINCIYWTFIIRDIVAQLGNVFKYKMYTGIK